MRLPVLVFLLPVLAVPVTAEEFLLSPVQDAYTCDCAPGTTNPNGGPSYLYQGPVYGCQVNLYIQWDMTEIGENMEITSAHLWLYCRSITGSVTGGTMIYYQITEPWVETSVTWNNMPSYSTSVSSISPWPEVHAWNSVDVTAFAQCWYDGSLDNYGLCGHYLETVGNCCAGFYSSNYANPAVRPYLQVVCEEVALDQDTWGEIKTVTP